MGVTQRSPTISTENQGIAAKVASDSGQSAADPPGDGPPLFEGESSLVRIRMLAESEPDFGKEKGHILNIKYSRATFNI